MASFHIQIFCRNYVALIIFYEVITKIDIITRFEK